MSSSRIENITTLTFDIFGTVLDLAGSLIPPLDDLLNQCPNTEQLNGKDVWAQWRHRQRIEQYQDNLLMLGHSGYLNVKKRALLYTLRSMKVDFKTTQIDEFMNSYNHLIPFSDAITSLEKLKTKFKIVMLSNGEHSYLEKLAAENIGIEFDSIYSAETAGQFKPHPSVYRLAANSLNLEPNQIMMVAAHSFDILGARHSGYRGAYVDRYDLPYDESKFIPDITVSNFDELCQELKV